MNFDTYTNAALGPIQKDEAVFLYGLTLALKPELVLEFGTFKGDSARCFLEGGAAKVVSIDLHIAPEAQELHDASGDRLDLWEMDQTKFRAESFRKVYAEDADVIFMDASHDLAANQAAWEEARLVLKYRGLLIIHGTGLWTAEHMEDEHKAFPGVWLTPDRFVHQPGAVEFAYDLHQCEGMQRIDIHSVNTRRQGMTIFQKREAAR